MIKIIVSASMFLGLAAQAPIVSEAQMKTKDPRAGFRWLDSSSDILGIALETNQLQAFGAEVGIQPSTDVEFEVVPVGPDSVRTTRRVYGRNGNGDRVMIEAVTEEVRSGGEHLFSATRTQSRRDANGNMQVILRQAQESIAAGAGLYRTRTTTMVPGVDGALLPSREIVQLEKKNANTVEIERIARVPSPNGGWMPEESRLSITRIEDGRSLTEEDIYRLDANGQLVLSQKSVSREWAGSQGTMVQEKEISLPNAAGRLEMNKRLEIVRWVYADGRRQMTQTLFQKSAADATAGLQAVETIVQTESPAGPNANERTTVILIPDLNGKLQIFSQTKAIVQNK